jgi:hypothetical protein
MSQTGNSMFSTDWGILICLEGRNVGFTGNQQFDHNPEKFGKLLLLYDFENIVEYLLCDIIQKNGFQVGSRFDIFLFTSDLTTAL